MDGAVGNLAVSQPRAGRLALPGRGGTVATLEFGPSDRPIDVVFSHANGFNALTYRTILQPVAGRMRILAYDLRGHGASDLPAVAEGRTDWDDYGDDLAALLRQLDLTGVVLAGHSMGATTSLLAAARAPERVAGLVLFEPVVMSREDRAQAQAGERPASALVTDTLKRRDLFASKPAAVDNYQGRGAFRGWTPAMVADYVEAGFRPHAGGGVELACAKAWEVSNYASQAHDTWGAFERVSCPIHILCAEHASTSRLALLGGGLAGDHVRIDHIAGASHFLPMERPELVAEALIAAVGAR